MLTDYVSQPHSLFSLNRNKRTQVWSSIIPLSKVWLFISGELTLSLQVSPITFPFQPRNVQTKGNNSTTTLTSFNRLSFCGLMQNKLNALLKQTIPRRLQPTLRVYTTSRRCGNAVPARLTQRRQNDWYFFCFCCVATGFRGNLKGAA